MRRLGRQQLLSAEQVVNNEKVAVERGVRKKLIQEVRNLVVEAEEVAQEILLQTPPTTNYH